MVRAKPFEYAPFRQLLEVMRQEGTETFADVQDRFVAAMSAFDREQAAGSLTSGEYQNKGLFFNEVIASLLERCAGVGVAQRGKRPGVLLESVDVDLCYPSAPNTRPAIIAEVKMAGTPQHPGNAGTTSVLGRRASADLDKRIREIALNVIDLKLADVEGRTTTIGDITTWIQRTAPAFFALFGLRVTDDNDLEIILARAQYLANSYGNGVGLVLYRARDNSTSAGRTDYVTIAPPRGMTIDDAVRRMCREIKAAAQRPVRPAE